MIGPVSTRRSRHSGGFSLLEIVIAMAILTILLIAMFSVLVSSQEVTLATGNSLDLDEQARAAVRILRRDLRQSGWEIDQSASMGSGVYLGNQLFLPKPTDTVGDTVQGTPATSVRTTGTHAFLCLFRQRIGFTGTGANSEFDNWTNDGGASPAGVVYVGWKAEWVENYKNVPGVIPRYRLQRYVGPTTTPTTKQGAAIQDLESASFKRLDWDEVEVSLTFLRPSMVRAGDAAPEPSRRKIVEIIKVNNVTAN